MIQSKSIHANLKASILKKISKRERIHITSGQHKLIIISILTTYGAISGFSSILYFAHHGMTWNFILLTSLLISLFIPLYFLVKKIADISIKGEHVMIKQFLNPCKVTSISSIRDLKTRKILKLTLTSLSYNIDGTRQKIILIKKIKNEANVPENVINFIKDVA